MKKNTTILLTFIGGAVTGGLICFAVLKDKYDILLAEEIEEMKKYFQKEIEDIDEDHFREMQDLVGELDDEERADSKYVDYVKKYSSPEDMVERNNYVNNDTETVDDLYKGIDESSYHDEEETLTYHSKEGDVDFDFTKDELSEFEMWDEHYAVDQDIIKRETPYTIPQYEFDNEQGHFDKITLYYYDIDSVLTDERDEVIPKIEDVIGGEALSLFGINSDDPSLVHVRNERYGADYEVVLMAESYRESVLGIPLDKNKKRKE